MKFLLDTHVFLWLITADPKLSSKVEKIIEDGRNELFFSSASAWEIVIKQSINKLQISSKIESFIPEQLMLNNINVLNINITHALNVSNLPVVHKDPFDRILISQAQVEKLPLITADKILSGYDVKIIW